MGYLDKVPPIDLLSLILGTTLKRASSKTWSLPTKHKPSNHSWT